MPSKSKPEVQKTLKALDKLYPDADCELDWKNPFQLVIATILSAQCTDKRVNMVTPALFARFPNPASLAKADPTELETIIKSTGFYRNKAKSILACSERIVSEFGGKVPDAMDDLLTLKGVARKTANVVLGTAFGKNEGIAVDTHVMRLTQRWKWTKKKDPVDIEQDIIKLIPRPRWTKTGHQIILHGRRVCEAKKPKCEGCVMNTFCPSAFKA